ncbi:MULTISPECIES: hypothetical protein [unclassified Variovorax]|uniref:hypothetical protein n=1 Tax=unclassified Variovorax TaxID=663243 RepID=UPI003ED03D11
MQKTFQVDGCSAWSRYRAHQQVGSSLIERRSVPAKPATRHGHEVAPICSIIVTLRLIAVD